MKTLFVVIGLIYTFAAQAEIYKWVDQDGSVHYSDTKPQDETVDVTEFFGSPTQIDDKGLVVQANQDAAPKATPPAKGEKVPEIKPEVTLSSLLVDAKEYVYSLLNGKPEKTSVKKITRPEKPQTIKPKESLPSPEETVVISNDNMGEMLDQIAQEKQALQEKEDALAKPSVEIFTAPWCGYCKKAIVYLELNKIPYEEYDVSTNSSAALRQQMLGGSGGVPFAVINGEKIRGWNKQAYARALGL